MTIHYHGTPITARRVLLTLKGRHFCVSFAAPSDVEVCHQIGQSVMLDNGAFSVWKRGIEPDWQGYYAWTDEWLNVPSTWAVIPDVIVGDAEQNALLIEQWPHGDRGAPVWHLHEPIVRLLRLVDEWPRVCFGSSGEYATVLSPSWRERVTEAFDEVSKRHKRMPWIHMLRGMNLVKFDWPFASVDSADVARNHQSESGRALQMVQRWDAMQCGQKSDHLAWRNLAKKLKATSSGASGRRRQRASGPGALRQRAASSVADVVEPPA